MPITGTSALAPIIGKKIKKGGNIMTRGKKKKTKTKSNTKGKSRRR